MKCLVVRRVEHQRCLVQLPGLHSDSSIFFFLKRHISLTQTRELEIVCVGDESTRVQRMFSGRTSVEPFHVFWSVSPYLQHDACNLSVLTMHATFQSSRCMQPFSPHDACNLSVLAPNKASHATFQSSLPSFVGKMATFSLHVIGSAVRHVLAIDCNTGNW